MVNEIPVKKRDYYEILGVVRTANDEEIKKAYRQAAMKYHPDRNPEDKSAEEKFKEASEAYEVLGDPAQRQRYDQFGHAGLSGTGFHHFTDVDDVFSTFGDLFDEFFGMGGVRRGQARSRRGADLSAEIAVSFAEAYAGVEKKLEVARREPCATCHGSGAASGSSRETCPRCRGSGQLARNQGFIMIATACDQCHGAGTILAHPYRDCRGEGRIRKKGKLSVKIPPGVDTGTQLLLHGEGDVGEEGGGKGDLYIFIRVQPQPDGRFVREGEHLFQELPISLVTAALGGEVEIETLHGARKIAVPRGVETGQTIVLEGEGFPHLRTKRPGDLVLRLVVKVPKHLTKKQEELLRQFAEEAGDSVKKKKGFFS